MIDNDAALQFGKNARQARAIAFLVILADIEEDLSQLGDLTPMPNGNDNSELRKAKERIRELEDMVQTLK